jgi:hypothetical protein
VVGSVDVARALIPRYVSSVLGICSRYSSLVLQKSEQSCALNYSLIIRSSWPRRRLVSDNPGGSHHVYSRLHAEPVRIDLARRKVRNRT